MNETIARRRVSRKHRRCMNGYPCGNRSIHPGDSYWSLSLPPGASPFNAKVWIHGVECVDCHDDRRGCPIDETAELGT